jgi:hypothetical protein
MKRLYEATNNYKFTLVFVNNNDSFTIELNKKNYSDVNKIRKEAENYFKELSGSDDFWIDEVILDQGIIKADNNINWTLILEELDQDIINLIFEEDSISLKLAFCQDYYGRGFTADNVTKFIYDIYVIEDPDWVYTGNDRFPEELVDEVMQSFYPDLLKALEEANAENYFDAVNIVRDMEYNGELRSKIIGDSFVYSWGDL